MNKKNKLSYIILCLLVCFSFVGTVVADDLNFVISATKDTNGEIVVGEKTSINISLQSDELINSCIFKISNDSNLVYEVPNALNNFSIQNESAENLELKYNSSETIDLSSGKNILKLNYTVNGSGKVTITTVECKTADGEKTGGYQDVVVEVTSKSKEVDTTLKSIEVNGELLSFFTPENKTPSINLTKPNFSLKLTTSNPDYQDSITVTDSEGNALNLDNITFTDSSGGQGYMPIHVTVGDDTNKTEYILGVRYEVKELDNSLASLRINGKDVELEEGKTEYTVLIGRDATEIKIEAVLKDSENFEFNVSEGPGVYDISSPAAVLTILPRDAQSGGKAVTYTITFEREATPSSSKPSSSSKESSSSNVTSNPGTGEISMFLMLVILMASLFGSVYLYRKNIEDNK